RPVLAAAIAIGSGRLKFAPSAVGDSAAVCAASAERDGSAPLTFRVIPALALSGASAALERCPPAHMLMTPRAIKAATTASRSRRWNLLADIRAILGKEFVAFWQHLLHLFNTAR